LVVPTPGTVFHNLVTGFGTTKLGSNTSYWNTIIINFFS
jgi:hypothetical protein